MGAADPDYSREYFDRLLQGSGDPRVQRRIARVRAYLELRPDDVVLETGCGPGLVAAALAADCRRVVAVDNSALALAMAREGRPDNIVWMLADLARLPWPAAAFDKIVFSEVVEHLLDPAPVLAELYRVLAPGGLMAVTTWPSRACLSWRLNYALGHGSPQDVNPQSPGSLRRLLRAAGFEVLDEQLDSFYWRVPPLGREFHGNPDGTPRQRWLESLVRGPWAALVGSSIKLKVRKAGSA